MRLVILITSLIIMFISCSNQTEENLSMIDNSFIQDLKLVQTKNIYFGHQSVGKNIMQGLTDLISMQNEVGFPVIDLDATDSLPEHYFAHSRIGANTDPRGKCDTFGNLLEHKISSIPDVALMKFCYVDINEKTDVPELFNYYKNTISKIKEKYPKLILVHVTVPLMANSGGWKIKVKRLINYLDYTDPANIKRNEFNNLLLETYKNEPIFDLARVESTYPDGKRESFKNNGKTYYSLIRDYTYDGGHLNATGRQLAAREMIRSIAKVFRDNGDHLED
jgi:hypothetical protein